MKTVLAPGAPWPAIKPAEPPKPKPKPKAKVSKCKKPAPTKHVKAMRGEIDFFKEAREAIASGKARGAMRKKDV